MLFRRRTKPHFWEVVRVSVWPRRTWRRSISYIAKRVLRLSASPHAIAAGFAAGAMVSFTPFMGLHFILAAALAWLIGGNVLASALGTFVGNPLTFPFIWGATLETGRLILYAGHEANVAPLHIGRMLRHLEFSQLWQPLIKPMTVGALPLGMVFAVFFYVLTRWATITFREQRRKRLAERARRRARAQSLGPRTATS